MAATALLSRRDRNQRLAAARVRIESSPIASGPVLCAPSASRRGLPASQPSACAPGPATGSSRRSCTHFVRSRLGASDDSERRPLRATSHLTAPPPIGRRRVRRDHLRGQLRRVPRGRQQRHRRGEDAPQGCARLVPRGRPQGVVRRHPGDERQERDARLRRPPLRRGDRRRRGLRHRPGQRRQVGRVGARQDRPHASPVTSRHPALLCWGSDSGSALGALMRG